MLRGTSPNQRRKVLSPSFSPGQFFSGRKTGGLQWSVTVVACRMWYAGTRVERLGLRGPGGSRRLGRPPRHHDPHRHRVHRPDGDCRQLPRHRRGLHILQAALSHQPLHRVPGRRRPHGGTGRPPVQRHLGGFQGSYL